MPRAGIENRPIPPRRVDDQTTVPFEPDVNGPLLFHPALPSTFSITTIPEAVTPAFDPLPSTHFAMDNQPQERAEELHPQVDDTPANTDIAPSSPSPARNPAPHARPSNPLQGRFLGTDEDPTLGVRTLHAVVCQHLAEAEELLAIARARMRIEDDLSVKLAELGRHSGARGAQQPTSAASAPASPFSPSSAPAASQPPFVSPASMSVFAPPPSSERWSSLSQGLGTAAAMLAGARDSALASLASLTSSSSTSSSSCASVSTNVHVDDESSLRPTLRTLREEYVALAVHHRRHADTLHAAVITPLQTMLDLNRRYLAEKKAEIDTASENIARFTSEVEARKVAHRAKCKIADDEDRKFKYVTGSDDPQPPSSPAPDPIMVGSRALAPNEIYHIADALRRDAKPKSVVTQLGLYEGVCMGSDLVDLLRKRHAGVSPRPDLKGICGELLARRFITPITGPHDAPFAPNLPYCFGRPMLKSGEPPHAKARREVEVAKAELDAAVDAAARAVGGIRALVEGYVEVAGRVERARLTTTRDAVLAIESAQVIAAGQAWKVWAAAGDAGSVGLLQPPPEQDAGLEYIAMKHGMVKLPGKRAEKEEAEAVVPSVVEAVTEEVGRVDDEGQVVG
ncbi:hypothetical protein BDK51DRAFT_48928 [Blyttiomyces helicus]|uniref:Uncharacterized protein n=1 Tax=Blyttiomyces helicus TaxID=388810 RepID=A0A4P9W492_9FUNG|nr:hypothetical protein BDK51DRAFT_48928 [Blyttiomyces helicus]|eukprot:RKO85500.1 hypothetical protein BDK51DRAFT_48928 [Blyttiomyces helicus]